MSRKLSVHLLMTTTCFQILLMTRTSNNHCFRHTNTLILKKSQAVSISCTVLFPVITEVPPNPPGAEVEGPIPDNYWEGDVVNYRCPPDQMSLTGTTNTTAHFNGSQWVLDDPDFSCYNGMLNINRTRILHYHNGL